MTEHTYCPSCKARSDQAHYSYCQREKAPAPHAGLILIKKWREVTETEPLSDVAVLLKIAAYRPYVVCASRTVWTDANDPARKLVFWNVEGVGGAEIENNFQNDDVVGWMPAPEVD